MAVETTFTGYIVVQFKDETTRKYEIKMFESGVDNMKTKIAALNRELANSTSANVSSFGSTFISSSEESDNANRFAKEIIEAGVTITESEIVYSVN